MDAVSDLIRECAKTQGTNLKALSRALGKNDAYMQQFCKRGTPHNLEVADRTKLADLLKVEPNALIRSSPPINKGSETLDLERTDVPQYDVRVSAGGEAVIESEQEIHRWQIPSAIAHSLAHTDTSGLMIVEVVGDSMSPTLKSGDHLMVDGNDKDLSISGIFALFDGSTVVVKRVEKIPVKPEGRLRLSSDNPLHGTYEVPLDTVRVAGRAVWYGRRL